MSLSNISVLLPVRQTVLDNGDLGVKSECGKLDIVLMHRPGKDMQRLTNDNLEDLLYDAIPDINAAHTSHDIFSQYLRDHGARVLYVTDLLSETLIASVAACHALIDGIISYCSINYMYSQPLLEALRQWLSARTPQQLADDATAGVARSENELGTCDHAQTILRHSSPKREFLVPPLPNLLFARDPFSVIEKHVFIWEMAKPGRQNEPLVLRTIFQYHPELSTSGLKICEWKTTCTNEQERPTIEGGDVAYIGNGVLLIGCGERTNDAGIEALARTGVFRQVIAVKIPPQRDSMHLDTVMSSVGKHAFTLHKALANQMEVFTVETHDANNNPHDKAKWTSYGCNVRSALQNLLNDDGLVFYDAADDETATIEQRDCRYNVLAIDDNHIMTYAGGDPVSGIASQMMRNNACQVGLVPTEGLLEGCGGMHCMTNPICRRR